MNTPEYERLVATDRLLGSDPRYLEIEDRFSQACDVVNELIEVIANTESFTPEVALEIGGNLVAYEHEADLHALDSQRRAAEFDEPRFGHYLRELNKGMLRSEMVMIEAQKGNYEPLKDFLPEFAEDLLQSTISVDKPEGSDLALRFVEKTVHLAGAIPDTGAPFIPTKPAWMRK